VSSYALQRHFPQMRFYRLDIALGDDIPLDDIGRIDELRHIGERFAEQINWTAILAGTDARFLINQRNTLPDQYTQSV
jgi:hypothetical protein